MFKRVLVPLDGSQLAEAALAPALAIAEKQGGAVLLLRVVVPAELDLAAGHGQGYYDLNKLWEKQERQKADYYLRQVRAEWQGCGVPLQLEVAVGAPPNVIVATAAHHGAQLIVMATHGRSGLGRLVYGSVAEAVLRGAEVPVLLVPIRSIRQRPPSIVAKEFGTADAP
jgi:nucleotide-binding universal stress UspA family protein